MFLDPTTFAAFLLHLNMCVAYVSTCFGCLGKVVGYPEMIFDCEIYRHSNISRADVHRTEATATVAESMCTET